MKKDIGRRLEIIRKKQGMTKEQFAKLIGVSGQYLGAVERGKHGLTIDKITRVCKETGVTSDYILFGKEEPPETVLSDLLTDFSTEQIQIAFEVIKNIAAFLKTNDANELLIKNVFSATTKTN